jgi:hypothetical protein
VDSAVFPFLHSMNPKVHLDAYQDQHVITTSSRKNVKGSCMALPGPRMQAWVDQNTPMISMRLAQSSARACKLWACMCVPSRASRRDDRKVMNKERDRIQMRPCLVSYL